MTAMIPRVGEQRSGRMPGHEHRIGGAGAAAARERKRWARLKKRKKKKKKRTRRDAMIVYLTLTGPSCCSGRVRAQLQRPTGRRRCRCRCRSAAGPAGGRDPGRRGRTGTDRSFSTRPEARATTCPERLADAHREQQRRRTRVSPGRMAPSAAAVRPCSGALCFRPSVRPCRSALSCVSAHFFAGNSGTLIDCLCAIASAATCLASASNSAALLRCVQLLSPACTPMSSCSSPCASTVHADTHAVKNVSAYRLDHSLGANHRLHCGGSTNADEGSSRPDAVDAEAMSSDGQGQGGRGAGEGWSATVRVWSVRWTGI